MEEVKKRKNSRQKGNGFERKIAKRLAVWSKLELRRTPLSGGWARQNPNAEGDITSIDTNAKFPFSVECKNNQSWNMEAIVQGSCKNLENWWEQCTRNCSEGKIPLLIFTKAYSADWICIQEKYVAGFEFNNYIIIGTRVVMLLEEFLKYPIEYFTGEPIGKGTHL